jgi:type II secretory pathway component PulM
MRLEELYIWQSWPVNRRKRYFQLAALAVAGVWVVLFLIFSGMTAGAKSDLTVERAKYERVSPLVQKVLVLQSQAGQLATLSPLAAVQQAGRDLGLEDRLVSIKPTQLMGGQEGVQLMFESLNLRELVDLLHTLNVKGRLKVLSCMLNHRLDDPELADIRLVLVR